MDHLFERFGLDKKETAAFLELVRLGPSPVSVWAKHAGINRSSMYVLLDRLIQSGLVSEFDHQGVKHVQAVSMHNLESLLQKQQQALSDAQAVLLQNLPRLTKLEKSSKLRPNVRFFEGAHRVEDMYEDVLEESGFVAYFHPGRVKAMMPVYFHKIPQTLRDRGGKARELLVRSKEANEYISSYRSDKHQMKMLPIGVDFSSDTIITGEKIYLVGYAQGDVVGTEIWNKELAETQAKIFDLVWAGIKDVISTSL